MARAVPADKCGVAFGLACGSAAVEVACGKLLVLVKQWVDSRLSLSPTEAVRKPHCFLESNQRRDPPGRSGSESYGSRGPRCKSERWKLIAFDSNWWGSLRPKGAVDLRNR